MTRGARKAKEPESESAEWGRSEEDESVGEADESRDSSAGAGANEANQSWRAGEDDE